MRKSTLQCNPTSSTVCHNERSLDDCLNNLWPAMEAALHSDSFAAGAVVFAAVAVILTTSLRRQAK